MTLPASPDPTSTRSRKGRVERIVFSHPESGWSVVKLRDEAGRGAEWTAVGPLLGVQPGETVRLTGRWKRDPKYGRQFAVDSFVTLRPETVDGMRNYLGSGMVPGIGKVMAERLVERFGLDTLDVIEREPERLAEVEGIGPVRSRRIRRAWEEQRGIRDVMVFLQSHRISTSQAIRIYRKWGVDAVRRVRENPYLLAEEVHGIGFPTADRIAESVGVARDSPLRLEAATLFVLERAAEEGHLFLPRRELAARAADLLAAPADAVEAAIERLAGDGRLVREPAVGQRVAGEPALYLPRLHDAESGLAASVGRLLAGRRDEAPPADVALAQFERREGIELAPEQREAVRRTLAAPLLVITGGPGTGKTTLVRAAVHILRGAGDRVLLAAPTGRAAKRLAEATGLGARTVHRLLEFDPQTGGFQRGREKPLAGDVVIVDEASMLDAPLADSLAAAVPTGSRLVLVGDVDQLPSVGPGRVLDDLIRSGRVPVVRLTRIYRQAARSEIVLNAHRIRRGEMPSLAETRPDADFFFIRREEPEEILATLTHLVGERIPRGFGIDPRDEIQVLTPMRRGMLGTKRLNADLQELLNPSGRRVKGGALPFRVGDRVMQVRNDYELDVFNGDVGRVRGWDEEAAELVVEIDGRRIAYDRAKVDQLVLAYACSVHKSQGSEYPCVVLPLHTQHRLLLERNLLYTAVTRARRLLVLVGSPRAVAIAVRTENRRERWSGLVARLEDGGG